MGVVEESSWSLTMKRKAKSGDIARFWWKKKIKSSTQEEERERNERQ